MKKLLTLIAILLLLLTQNTQAKIWRVNNNIGVNANYTDIQSAINAAATGDTIHIEGSATTYGGFTLTKRLVIMGTGYFLTETTPLVANAKTEANLNQSNIGGYAYLNPGSKGSVLTGLPFIYGNGVVLEDSLLTIQRCYIEGGVYLGDNGTSYTVLGDTIRQNYISGGITAGSGSTGKYSGILIYNNIFTGSGAISFGNNINNISGFIINNDFAYYYSSFSSNPAGITSANFVYQNNIFGYVNFGAYQTSNVYFNNICNGTGVPSGNSNVQNVDPSATVYNDWTGNGAGFSSDSRYQLKSNATPAHNAGTINSTTIDCGAFGGPAPYILSGMPNAPSIYALTVPTQINSGTLSMNITVSSASH